MGPRSGQRTGFREGWGRAWYDGWMCTHTCVKPLMVENGPGRGRDGMAVGSGLVASFQDVILFRSGTPTCLRLLNLKLVFV